MHPDFSKFPKEAQDLKSPGEKKKKNNLSQFQVENWTSDSRVIRENLLHMMLLFFTSWSQVAM